MCPFGITSCVCSSFIQEMCLWYAARWHFLETFLGVYETTATFPDNLCDQIQSHKGLKKDKSAKRRCIPYIALNNPVKRKITMQPVQLWRRRWRKQVIRQDRNTSTVRRIANEAIRFFRAHHKLVVSRNQPTQLVKNPYNNDQISFGNTCIVLFISVVPF